MRFSTTELGELESEIAVGRRSRAALELDFSESSSRAQVLAMALKHQTRCPWARHDWMWLRAGRTGLPTRTGRAR